MQLVSAGLENHPDGSGNINNIVNGNWNNIEAWFNPAAGYTASQSGTTVTASSAVFGTWDVGSTIRFADGTTDTIATVTDSTHAEVGVSRTVSSQAFYLYETGEALRGTLLRGLLGVTQIDATAHNDKFLVVNSTTEKLEAVDGLSFDGTDFLFTEPVVIDDDAGAVSTEAMLTIRRNMVATSGSNWAFVSAATVEPAGASTAKSTAGYFTINTSNAAGNITTGGTGIGVNGLYVNPGHSNTTYTLDLLTGLYVLCTHGSGAANLAQMDGITIYMDAAAASTTDLLRALYIPTIQRSGGADSWFAIYQSGTADRNYFAGTTQFDGIRGSMYQTNTSTSVTVSVTDTWYEITTGWTDGGNGNDTTFQNSHEILVATAGVYWISWHIAVTVGTAAQNIEATITVNGTADTNLSNHVYVGNTTQDYPFSGQGLVALSASDVVALAVRNRTGTNNITVEHAGLSLFCVGT